MRRTGWWRWVWCSSTSRAACSTSPRVSSGPWRCTCCTCCTSRCRTALAVVGALLAAVVMGLVVERLVVRPLFDAPRVTLLVATAGVALLAVGSGDLVRRRAGQGHRPGAADPRPVHDPRRAGLRPAALVLIVVLVVLAVRARAGSSTGRTSGWPSWAPARSRTATELVGISVRRLSSFTWALAALLGGLAAVIAVPETGSFTPGVVTFAYLIPAFTAAVLGGMTSLPGAFLGGVHHRHRPVGGRERTDLRRHPGQPRDAHGLHRARSPSWLIRPQGLLGKAG